MNLRGLFILMVWIAVSSGELIYKDVIDNIKFGPLENYWDEGEVVYLQKNDASSAHFWVASANSIGLLSTDNEYTHLLGNTEVNPGYREGEGDEAIFQAITGFVQHNTSHLIVVDMGNDCLRWVDVRTDSTSPMAGKCNRRGEKRSEDGTFTSARFNAPRRIIAGRSEQKYYVTERVGDAIRIINVLEQIVTTLIRAGDDGTWKLPSAMALDSKREILYFTAFADIVAIDLESEEIREMTSGERSIKDGKLSESRVDIGKDLILVTDNVLIALSSLNSTIRFINLKEQFVSSLPDQSKYKNSNCLLHVPDDSAVYLCGKYGIAKLPYMPANGSTTMSAGMLSVLALLSALVFTG